MHKFKDRKYCLYTKNIVVAVFICVLALPLTACGTTKLIKKPASIKFDVDYPVGQITSAVTVTQSFVSNCDEIRDIQLFGATYKRKNTATVVVKLYKGTKEEIEDSADTKVIQDDGLAAVQDDGLAAVQDDGLATVENSGVEFEENSKVIAEWTIDSALMEDNSVITLCVDPDKSSSCVVSQKISELNQGLNGQPCLIEISSPDGEPELSPTFWMTEEDVYADGCLSIAGYDQYNDIWFQVRGK